MNNKRYIVTGAAGFIGSHICDKLLKLGHHVVGIDNFLTGIRENLPIHKNFTFLEIDLSDWNSLSRFYGHLKDFDGVFHTAARARIQPSIKDPYLTHKNNVDATFNLLEMMRICNIDKIVYSASSSSYGRKTKIPCAETQEPDCLNPYAISKLIGEQYCKTWGKIYGIKNVCLKYFNVYGPRSPLSTSYAPIIGLFFKQGIKDKNLTIVGDGEQRRDFTYYKDIVTANLVAMGNIDKFSGETFNIGTGVNYSINEIVTMVIGALNRSGIHMITTSNIPRRPAEARVTLADITKTQKYFGWHPSFKLEDKIDEMCEYYIKTIK